MDRTIIIGRLTTEPVIHYGGKYEEVCTFTVSDRTFDGGVNGVIIVDVILSQALSMSCITKVSKSITHIAVSIAQWRTSGLVYWMKKMKKMTMDGPCMTMLLMTGTFKFTSAI